MGGRARHERVRGRLRAVTCASAPVSGRPRVDHDRRRRQGKTLQLVAKYADATSIFRPRDDPPQVRGHPATARRSAEPGDQRSTLQACDSHRAEARNRRGRSRSWFGSAMSDAGAQHVILASATSWTRERSGSWRDVIPAVHALGDDLRRGRGDPFAAGNRLGGRLHSLAIDGASPTGVGAQPYEDRRAPPATRPPPAPRHRAWHLPQPGASSQTGESRAAGRTYRQALRTGRHQYAIPTGRWSISIDADPGAHPVQPLERSPRSLGVAGEDRGPRRCAAG
jgi:hypothetical protein